jgi:hypothetical protein
MSFSSKPKKIKGKGAFRELKVVQTVSRKGYDAVKTEEIKTPNRGTSNGTSSRNTNNSSSSPTKRPRLETVDIEPIMFDLEGPSISEKRQTLVSD